MSPVQPSSSEPVVRQLADFDVKSGGLPERLLFNHRAIVIVVCLALTALLGWQLSRLRLNASFEKTIPTSHPFIVNYLQNKADLTGLGNALRIVVEAPGDSIYDAAYLQTLSRINDEVFLIPGVDRPFMKSLWTPNTRWRAVVEEGLTGGTVIPSDYDGSPGSLARVRTNVERSGEIGQLVALDFKSSLLYVPLLELDTETGGALDYAKLSDRLEDLRARYAAQGVRLHITGFAKVVGDLIEGVRAIILFFGAAVLIATAMLWWYTRCARSTLLVVACSLVAVVWQLGLLPLLGYELDPYSVLVPFLVFAMGMSHGAQKMNGIMQDIGRGAHRLVAARMTFRRLFMAGLMALVSDAVGFAVLMLIPIGAIQDLALTASLGVAVLIFTNLILLPVVLSYTGVSPAAAARCLRAEQAETMAGGMQAVWRFLAGFTQRRRAAIALGLCAVLAAGGYAVSRHLRIGDLDPGAPELRANSRYNRDNAYLTAHYGASSDVFVVMMKTPEGGATLYANQARMDALEWELRRLPGVDTTQSLPTLSRMVNVMFNEGNAKWYELMPSQAMLNSVLASAPRDLFNFDASRTMLFVYLKDHKADTLTRVVDTVEKFAAAHDTPDARFLLAAGSAGFEAATNIVVKKAGREMLWWVYGAVILLCLLTFRSWRAVVSAIVPLVVTSILCEALMVGLGIGMKVATLPVIALGVGIGVDYALYVLSIMLACRRAGMDLYSAYYSALRFTGRVVMLTGVTLAIGVATWVFSPIKFQADMGVLLAFMFLWNMLGALILLPALACFLLPDPAGASAKRGEARAATPLAVNGPVGLADFQTTESKP